MRSGDDDRSAGAPVRCVVLVGFMGSGKTTVGGRLARRLDWSFVDLDAAVESRAGASIEALFRERGEAYFRELEERLGREMLSGRERVVSTGGGWAAAPGRLDALEPDILSVWLKVSPGTAVERAGAGSTVRPLLEVPDPEAKARELIRARTPFYRRARLHMDTDGRSPEDLVTAILEHLGRPVP